MHGQAYLGRFYYLICSENISFNACALLYGRRWRLRHRVACPIQGTSPLLASCCADRAALRLLKSRPTAARAGPAGQAAWRLRHQGRHSSPGWRVHGHRHLALLHGGISTLHGEDPLLRVVMCSEVGPVRAGHHNCGISDSPNHNCEVWGESAHAIELRNNSG